MNYHYPVGLLILSSVFGCSTPQIVFDQANNGAALTASLESELREFRRVQVKVANSRIAAVREQRALMAEYESSTKFSDRVREAAGKTDHARVYNILRALADSRGKDEEELQLQLKALDESLAKLLAPLPDGSDKLRASQAALSAMAVELSTSDRINAVTEFAKEIKKSVDENRKKIEEAEAEAEVEKVTPQNKPESN